MKHNVFSVGLISSLLLLSFFLVGQNGVLAAVPAAGASNTPTRPATSVVAPDLVVQSLSLAYTAGSSNGSCRLYDDFVGLNAVIKNNGNMDAGPFVISVDGRQFSIAGLAVGQTTSVTTPPGMYPNRSITATADVQNQVVELNETNNSLTATLPLEPLCTVTPTPTVDPVLPDLIVSSFGQAIDPSIQHFGNCYSSAPVYGTQIVVKNIGGVAAGTFFVDVTNPNTSLRQTVTGLGAGQIVTLWFNLSLTRPITTTLDPTNLVAESNENNSVTLRIGSGTSTPTGTLPPPPVICTPTATQITPTPVSTACDTPGACTPTVTPRPGCGTVVVVTSTPSPTFTPTPRVATATNTPSCGPIFITATPSIASATPTPPADITVTGFVQTTVLDTVVPVAGAKVQAGLNHGRLVSTTTAADGSYSLFLPGAYFVGFGANFTVSATGYQTFTAFYSEASLRANPVRSFMLVAVSQPTLTPTPSVSPSPTRTPTITPTGLVGVACSPVTASVAAPFTRDGAGSFCWQSTNLGSYINSWNMASLTVNGVNFTNQYVPAASLPAKINGFWYVSYTANFSWSHFEAK